MIEKNNIQRVLGWFFDNPTTETHLRELSRAMRLSMPAILSAVKKLENLNLVAVKKGKAVTAIRANLENISFARLKRIYNIESLYASGLVDYLHKEFKIPKAVICFGSYSRGEDTEKSDIDIAIIGSAEKQLQLGKFEKKLKRSVSIHNIFLNRVSEEFKANIYNGIILEGAL